MRTLLAKLVGKFGGILIPPADSAANPNPDLARACFDSRRVQPGDLFCALSGARSNGSTYVQDAVVAGAKAVLLTEVQPSCPLPQWVVPDPARPLAAQVAATLAGSPSQSLFLAGVTGTNGKTTCVHLLQQALNRAGLSCARLGTLGFQFEGWERNTSNTTPSADEVQNCLADAQDRGAKAMVLEASSHGLDQHRLDGLEWNAAAWTNLSRDHLDYHLDMETYARAKARLVHALPEDSPAWIPLGDENIAQACAGSRCQTLTYALNRPADLWATLNSDLQGLRLSIQGVLGEVTLTSSLVGRFNAENLLLSFALACTAGLTPERAAKVLAKSAAAPGRLQRIARQSPWALYVDYAHTPDALTRALQALREVHPRSRVGVVFGAGGDRDPGKRAAMGEAAGRGADWCLVTSDNPRTEDPEAIVQQVSAGVRATSADLQEEVNRAVAIPQAVAQLASGDVLLVAGKGHEDYQEIHGVRHPFDDAVHLREAVACLV